MNEVSATQRTQARRYWNSLSDDTLLEAEFTTDDPENLPNLVTEIPPGDEESYVEYKYDLRGSDREELKCVYDNHPHLSGFVMRKGEKRFLVGRICAKKIYGENFDGYEADFNAAVNRQTSLRRRRDVERELLRFQSWLQRVGHSGVFTEYERVRNQLSSRLPWLWENAPRIFLTTSWPGNLKAPKRMFAPRSGLEDEYQKAAAESAALVTALVGWTDLDDAALVMRLKTRLYAMIRRAETVLTGLVEMTDFFQPASLQAMCQLASRLDNPDKRKYEPRLVSILCLRSGKESVSLGLSDSFMLPNAEELAAIKTAIERL
jgi:hypothetical protein